MNSHVSNGAGPETVDLPAADVVRAQVEIVPHPDPFLEPILSRQPSFSPPKPGLTAVCAGFEAGHWRCERLAEHLIDWLPEFALSPSEYASISGRTMTVQLRRAAQLVYRTAHNRRRGEVGELLLHVLIRQTFQTQLAVSKIFFKDSANDTVKGFDAVHVVASTHGLELWLGEAKFYSNALEAIRDAAKSIREHAEADFMRREFVAITNKLDPAWRHSEKLAQLLHPNTSLDQVFERLCVPVLITYDSDTLAQFAVRSPEYITAIRAELDSLFENFCGRRIPSKIRIHLFFVPLNTKDALSDAVDRRLRACQTI